MKSKIKIHEVILVIAALAIAIYVGKNIGIEYVLRGNEEPVSIADAKEDHLGEYLGMPAGKDIPRINTLSEWEDIRTSTEYITIEPAEAIPTGIGSRSAWVPAYKRATRSSRGGQRSEIKKKVWDIFGEYTEYYILQLSDGQHILAQIPMEEARRIQSGQAVTLPLGNKTSINSSALPYLKEICEKYDVSLDGQFYCINNKWNESHTLTVLILRFAAGGLVLIVSGALFLTAADKLLGTKKKVK